MSIKKKIIFKHGLALSNHFWKNMLPFFKEYQPILLDDNYFFHQKDVKIKESDHNNIIEIGIGHSLGFFKLHNQFPNLKYFIGINTFTNFLGNNLKLQKIRMNEYKIFKRNFLKDPKNTMKNFYIRSGIEYKDNNFDLSNLNSDKIIEDIKLLIEPIKILHNANYLIINSLDDLIVPHSISQDNFSNFAESFADSDNKIKIIYFKSGKHALGFKYAEKISQAILEFIP